MSVALDEMYQRQVYATERWWYDQQIVLMVLSMLQEEVALMEAALLEVVGGLSLPRLGGVWMVDRRRGVWMVDRRLDSLGPVCTTLGYGGLCRTDS